MKNNKKEVIYLDYASTTPLSNRVLEKMILYLDDSKNFGNPSSIHQYGKRVKEAIELARYKVAKFIGADPVEIIWTSGATESNNLAIKGVWEANKHKGNHIITSRIEHKSILDTCLYLQNFHGAVVTFIAPESNGIVDPEKVTKAIKEDTILISIMHVNNEVGAIQDIESIGNIAKKNKIFFHVDAAQSIGKLKINLKKLNIDLMSLSAHKLYGPKGIGCLFVKKDSNSRPLINCQIHGGGQENNLRSGTLPTHQIVGMGEAYSIIEEEFVRENDRIHKLNDILRQGLMLIEDITINSDLKQCIPHILNVSFQFIESANLLAALDDIAISSTSACTSEKLEASHVLQAMGISRDINRSAVRFSLGRYTSEDDINYTINKLREIIPILKTKSPLWKICKEL